MNTPKIRVTDKENNSAWRNHRAVVSRKAYIRDLKDQLDELWDDVVDE